MGVGGSAGRGLGALAGALDVILAIFHGNAFINLRFWHLTSFRRRVLQGVFAPGPFLSHLPYT